ncbi:biotin/lipoyl-binding protein [Tepidiphilus sp. B18-69]|uniref:Biotin/lipoyl-binding protein n=1 Tax=Tepidiphilus baoligensis TaxID=2698687 RepID=A0ABX1QKB5_9PROT|nr:biotin/lipoyl-binding protein [Tepidiphilus baoligensis]
MQRWGWMVAACVLLAGCGRQETPAQQQEQPVVVRTAPVRAAEPAPLVLSGTVRARHETPLAFQVGGRIVARLVDAGASVQTGQVLARLDPKDVLARLEAAQAEVRAAQAQWRLAQNELARTERLQRSSSWASRRSTGRALSWRPRARSSKRRKPRNGRHVTLWVIPSCVPRPTGC